MHPLIDQQMAQYQIDTFARDVRAARLAALVNASSERPIGLHGRFARTAGRLRLIRHRRPAAA